MLGSAAFKELRDFLPQTKCISSPAQVIHACTHSLCICSTLQRPEVDKTNMLIALGWPLVGDTIKILVIL